MTQEDAIKQLRELDEDDEEAAHSEADEVLIRFLMASGFKDVADVYMEMRDKIGFWYA
jgi:hypothetical protein